MASEEIEPLVEQLQESECALAATETMFITLLE